MACVLTGKGRGREEVKREQQSQGILQGIPGGLCVIVKRGRDEGHEA